MTDESPEAVVDDAKGSGGEAAEPGGRGWRYWTGMVVLVVASILPLIALIVLPVLGLPNNVNTVVFGLSLAGGPDVLFVAAAAIMGKENMGQIVAKIGPWFRRIIRWDTVTRRRYTIGLWVLTIAFLVPYPIAVFFEDSVATTDGRAGWGWYIMAASSLAFALAFLSMGGPLWERVRAIYSWDAKISFPAEGSDAAEAPS